MKPAIVVGLILAVLVCGCATTGKVPQKTQLEIREFQTRTYDTDSLKMVMKAMINVLQDDGYILKNADLELGILNATKEMDVESKGEAFFLSVLGGDNARWKKNSIVEATGNITQYGEQCRVRMNFQLKVMDNRGNVMEVKQIADEKHYQDFFAKVDKGIFIEKEKL